MSQLEDATVLMPERDNEGYLLDANAWGPALAPLLAAENGLDLSAAHWELIGFIRDYYDDHQSVPEARRAIQFLAQSTGDKRSAKLKLYELFPHGYGQQACRVAGMRKPLKLMLDL